MEKIKQVLKKKVEDDVAAFTILGAIIITFSIAIITLECVQKMKVLEVSANSNLAQLEENTNTENTENFDTIDEITSQEELKKMAEKEEEKKKDEKEETSSNKSSHKYYIKVNYGAQVVTIYTRDEHGNYTVPAKAMVGSTGTHTPTSGVYTIGYRWEWLRMIGDVYGHYVTQINGDILFHSVPYLEKGNHSSLEWWAYDQLGTKASLGCVRLTTKDALWIFNNISSGTKVEFYSSSNPGPLGKPSAMKISNAPSSVKGWDPTDPDPNNPWPEYLEELENKKDEEENKEPEEPNKDDENDDKNNNVNDTEGTGGNNQVNDIESGENNDINDIETDNNNQVNDVGNNDTNGVNNDINNIENSDNDVEDNVYVSEIR